MAILSLRATISILSALSVAIVASITLSITLTSSLSALRSIGQTHSKSLLTNAQLQTESLFHRPVIVTETIINVTRSKAWAWPSDDAAVLAMYRTMAMDQFLACEGYCTVTIVFTDNTYIQIYPNNADLYWGFVMLAAPYSIGGVAYQQTQAINVSLFAGYWANNTSPPSTHPILNQRIPTSLVTTTAAWYQHLATYPASSGPVYGGVLTTPRALDRSSVTLFAYGLTTSSSVYLATSISVDMGAVKGFLTSIAGTPNTEIFSYDDGGFLIGTNMAAPTQTQFTVNASYVAPPGCISNFMYAAGVPGSVLLGTCRAHISQYSSAPLNNLASRTGDVFVNGQVVGIFDVAGDTYYYAVAKVNIKYPGMGVWLALIMPEADVLGDVVKGRNTAIGVTCAVFVVASLATFVAIALLLRPLTTIADRMMLAASLEDDGDDERQLSSMAEVEDLQQAYYAMNDELNRIKSFVPKSVLRKADDPDLISNSGNKSDNASVTTRATERRVARLNHLECGLVAQNVTVVCGNLDGFDAAVQSMSRDAVVARMAEYVHAIHETAVSSKGVVHSIHGDHFVVTFNAVSMCPSHARRGATAALQLTERVAGSALKLPLRAGVATGKCLVGNLGSQEAKAFNTIGPAFVQAGLLEKLTRRYGPECHVLANRRTCNDLTTHLRFRYVDIVPLPVEPTLVGVVLGALLNPGDSGREQEWLYVVGDASETVDDVINEAFGCLADGHRDACAAIIAAKLANLDLKGATGPDGVRCCLARHLEAAGAAP